MTRTTDRMKTQVKPLKPALSLAAGRYTQFANDN